MRPVESSDSLSNDLGQSVGGRWKLYIYALSGSMLASVKE